MYICLILLVMVKSPGERSNQAYQRTTYDFASSVLVSCPKCQKEAVVQAEDFFNPKPAFSQIKVVCPSCGFNKMLSNISKREDLKQKKGNVLIFGAPVDPYFHFPLWLQAEFKGNIFWAYNHAHLSLLEEHIAAFLRERSGFPYKVRSIGARLPRWMTSATNRDGILKIIRLLKNKKN